MSFFRTIAVAALSLLLAAFLTPEANAAQPVCSVGGVSYESLSAALAALSSGSVEGDITLLSDCVLDVGEIRSDLSIDGGGHRLSVPTQSATESGALNINAALSFNNTTVSFSNPSNWSAVLGPAGALSLTGSACSFRSCGIYASPGAKVTLDSSQMVLEDMAYTCMMAEAYAALEIKNGSSLLISEPEGINGITGFNISCDASTLSVLGCARQGLVKCSLTLTNGAFADISSNGYGYNLYSGNILSVGEGTRLRMNSNSTGAILMQGRSTVNVKSGGSFECRFNGAAWKAENTDEQYGSKAAVNVGWFNSSHIFTTGGFNAENGADVVISDNYVRAVSNYGTLFLGSGSVVTRNGRLLDTQSAQDRRIERGGGVYNAGTAVLAQGAAVYNNHAALAADDLFNAEGAPVTLPATGRFWMLSDCGDAISGWYHDLTGKRWNVHGAGELFAEELTPGGYIQQLEIKAAHGIGGPPQTGDNSEASLWGALLCASALGALFIARLLRKRG